MELRNTAEIKDNKILMQSIGNIDLLILSKTAFLCSRKVPAGIILKCYDWAIEQKNKGSCIIGGFHSKIEKDVLHFLLKGDQPLIIVLARSLYKRWDKEIKERLDKGNLLIISICPDYQKRADEKSCRLRNEYIIDNADQIVIGYMTPQGNLNELVTRKGKAIILL